MIKSFDPARYCENLGDKVFLQARDTQVSFDYFLRESSAISEKLKDKGITNGDIVLITDVDIKFYIPVLFALWKIAAIAFPVNPRLTDQQLKTILSETGALHIIGKTKHTIFTDQIFLSQDDLRTNVPTDNPGNFNLDPEQPVTLVMTSGSSGKPKYALHSFKNHYYNAMGVNAFFNFCEQDNWLLSLPLFHVGGMGIIFRCFLAGATLSLQDQKKSLTDELLYHRPTHISLVFTQLQRLFNTKPAIAALKKCKAIFLGGSAIPQNVLDVAEENHLNIFSGYGLTEMASTVAIRNHQIEKSNQAEILKYREVTVINDEICVKGLCLFKGYLDRPQRGLPLTDGWFYTKDKGKKTGNKISVFGRLDNMFISGGENIQPEEIERVLLTYKNMGQAVVVPVENKEYGQRPVAFIKSYGKIKKENLIKYLQEKLPSFMIPDQFFNWPENSEKNLKINRDGFRKLAGKLYRK